MKYSTEAILGVSVKYLSSTFYEECKTYLNSRGKDVSTALVYDIEDLREPTGMIREKGKAIISKEDGKLGASYIDCLKDEDDVGEATHMLSYSWGNKISDIIMALNSYCDRNQLPKNRTYIWICCLCNNQNRLKENIERGENEPMEEFERIFKEKVLRIGHVLSLMVPWNKPIYIKRVWCLFELFTTIQNDCTLDVIMPKREEKNLLNTILKTNGYQEILKALSKTRIQDADATVKDDKDKILHLIESGTGYAYVNGRINNRIRIWVNETLAKAVQTKKSESENATEDLDLSLLYNEVGLVFENDGQYDRAIKYYKKSLSIEENVGGKEHKNMATGYNNIAMAYKEKGEYKNALKYLNQSLTINKKVMGEEHESTAISYNNIGLVYWKKGDYNNALENHQKSLTIRKEVLGEHHLQTARSFNNIGAVYRDKKDNKMALLFYRKCLDIREKEYGDGHPITAYTYNGIALVYENTKNLEKATKFIRKALDIREKVLGENHPLTKESRISYERICSKNAHRKLLLKDIEKLPQDQYKVLGFTLACMTLSLAIFNRDHVFHAIHS